jgi:hypothetical protein
MTTGLVFRDIDKARPARRHIFDYTAAPVVVIDKLDMDFLPTMSSLTFGERNLILRLEHRIC